MSTEKRIVDPNEMCHEGTTPSRRAAEHFIAKTAATDMLSAKYRFIFQEESVSDRVDPDESGAVREFADLLQQLRQECGNPTLTTISNSIGSGIDGVSIASLSRYFSGKGLPSEDALWAILDALKVKDKALYSFWQELRRRVDLHARQEDWVSRRDRKRHSQTKDLIQQAFTLDGRANLAPQQLRISKFAVDELRTLLEGEKSFPFIVSCVPDYAQDLTKALMLCARSLTKMGRLEEAEIAASETVRNYLDLTAASPEDFQISYAMSLEVWGDCLSKKGEYESAAMARIEASNIHLALVKDLKKDVDRDVIAKIFDHRIKARDSLARAVNDLLSIEYIEEATLLSEALLELQLSLPLDRDKEHYLSQIVSILMDLYKRLERWEDVTHIAKQSIQLFRDMLNASPGDEKSGAAAVIVELETWIGEEAARKKGSPDAS